MARIVEPPDIAAIFDKPGRLWTPNERRRVKEWLHEEWVYGEGYRKQLAYLLTFALRHLGYGATPEDAEDTWGKFCEWRLDAVIISYDPDKGRRFWGYLKLCFKRFCWAEGKRIRVRQGIEVPLEPLGEVIGGGEGGEREEDLIECVNELPEPYFTVIVMHYFEGWSVKEIAAALDITEDNVKVRLFRARQKLRECLERD